MPNSETRCGLCDASAHEADQLVQLGKMGYICLCCLEQVASAVLPMPVLAAGAPPARRVDQLTPATDGKVLTMPIKPC